MDVPQQTDWYLQSITAALKRLNAAANECQERLLTHHDGSIKDISANQTAHDNLVMEASKFLQTAQGPIDTVATCFERVRLAPLVSAISPLPLMHFVRQPI